MNAPSLEAIASEMFGFLASTFPVCSASDEFYYFPQVVPKDRNWAVWDDFSPEAVQEAARRLSARERELARQAPDCPDADIRVDLQLLSETARTLREQLTEVRFQTTQPTFHLTVASIGLAEALDSTDPGGWYERIGTLPAFLRRAGRLLRDVPVPFRDAGMEMIETLRAWLVSVAGDRTGTLGALEALEGFREVLGRVSTATRFQLDSELLERVVRDHLGCGLRTMDVLDELDREIAAMLRTLEREARRLQPGAAWAEVYAGAPRLAVGNEGVLARYRYEIERLGQHCAEAGLVDSRLAARCPVRVAVVPPSLRAIRAADAYSATPGHPPTGGVFFVLEHDVSTLHPEHRMLLAHETWPGHHLLDASRWNLERPVRRALERPLFYEGWACFAEELLARTGYLHEPWDRLILAKRRLTRAVRGRVELLLQTGSMELSQAAAELTRAGIPEHLARSAANKYALRPGYQLCYTVGVRRFLALFEGWSREGPAGFARRVLGEGEIGFDDLERRLFDRAEKG